MHKNATEKIRFVSYSEEMLNADERLAPALCRRGLWWLKMRLSCGSICPWVKNNLGAVVLLVAEDFVHFWCLINRHSMADHEAGIDFAALHPVEQRLHVAHHVGLAGLHGQCLVHVLAYRHFVDESAVHAGHRNRPTLTARDDALAQNVGTVRLHTKNLLAAINHPDRPVVVRFHANSVHAR